MARARNIKPGFFTNDVLGELPALARLLFAGVWTLCDREGRVEDRPKKIKAEVLPYDDCDADKLLEMLAHKGFLQRYQVGQTRVIQVLSWNKHQNPHMKEAASSLPAPDEHGASTVLVPDGVLPEPERAGLIPSLDSLSLDSLNTETPPKAGRFVPPEWIPAETWASYLKTRTKKRAANEPHALGLIVKDLEGFRNQGLDPVAILEKSIKSGWSGVFAPQDNRSKAAATGETAWQRSQRERVAQMTGGLLSAKPPTETFDMETGNVTPLSLG